MTPKQPASKQTQRKYTKKDDKPAVTDWAKVAKARRALYEYWKDLLDGIPNGMCTFSPV